MMTGGLISVLIPREPELAEICWCAGLRGSLRGPCWIEGVVLEVHSIVLQQVSVLLEACLVLQVRGVLA